jgi:hypothetical protein
MKMAFELGVGQYDAPLPGSLGDLTEWREADLFRFANRLEALIEIDDEGRIAAWDYTGGGLIASTTPRIGRASTTFTAFSSPTCRPSRR